MICGNWWHVLLLSLEQVWPVKSRGGFCIMLRWSRWQRQPRLWWRPWATFRPPSPAPPTSSTSDQCLRYSVHVHTQTFCLDANTHPIISWSLIAGMDTLPGSVQRGSAGLWWHWGGLSVPGGNPLCYQDSVHLHHSGNFTHCSNREEVIDWSWEKPSICLHYYSVCLCIYTHTNKIYTHLYINIIHIHSTHIYSM